MVSNLLLQLVHSSNHIHINHSLFGGGGGCLPAGSLVWLADGSHAPIESITEGQYIWSWNESSRMLEIKEVFVVMQPRMCPVYDMTLSDGRLIQTTAEHPFMINEVGVGVQ